MKKIKHNKYKNTGIIFELLVRQIAIDTMNNKDSIATNIIKKHFGNKTDLAKELRLYQSTLKETFESEYKASEFLNVILTERSKLNNVNLSKQKYNLIKDIKKHFVIENFFKHRVTAYKENASIYKLFEYNSGDNPKQYVECKSTLLEHISGKTKSDEVVSKVNEEYSKQPKEVRLLAWKLLVENFNDKYNTLSTKQRSILRQYINTADNSQNLKKFVVKECNNLSGLLGKINITDDVIKIKINEVIKLIDKIKSAKTITESQILSLLRYYELNKELKKVYK